MNYSTIEEAWGDLSGRKKKKKTQVDPICELYNQQTELTNLASEIYQKQAKKTSSSFEDAFAPVMTVKTNEPTVQETTRNMEEYTVPLERYTRSSDDNENYDKPIYQENRYIETPRCREPENNPRYREPDTIAKPIYQETRYREPNTIVKPIYQENRYSEPPVKYIYPAPQECKQDINNYYYSKQEYIPQLIDNYNEYKPVKSNLPILDVILYIISGIILIFLMDQFIRIGISMKQYSL